MGAMLDYRTLYEIFWLFILAAYAFIVIFLTKKFYDFMLTKHFTKKVAVYYNRKLIHIFAGGIVVLIVPFVFSSPWFPLFSAIVMTIIMYIAHRRGNTFYWFQTEDNINDVSFCFMWGIAIFVLWIIFGNPWIAIIPPAFIAFGDGITGIVRNIAFKERRKHIIGNIYMMGVCIPIGYYFASAGGPSIPLWGVIAAVVASLFERYEFGIIDDNVLVAGSATLLLYIGGILGPIG
jgi:hypothetical protein